MDNAVTRAANARAAAAPPAPGELKPTTTRTVAAAARSGIFGPFVRATSGPPDTATKSGDGKPVNTDDDPDDTSGKGEDAAAADKASDDTDDTAKEKKLPNAVDRTADVDDPHHPHSEHVPVNAGKGTERAAPTVEDKDNTDLTETPWNDKEDDSNEEDTPHTLADDDSPHLKDTEREFSYEFHSGTSDTVPLPLNQSDDDKSKDRDKKTTDDVVSFDSTPTPDDETRGKFDGGDNDPVPDTNVSAFPEGGSGDDDD